MADTDETSQVEGVSQSHDNEKPSNVKASENIASVASQGAVLSPPQPQAQPVHVQQSPPQQQQQPQIISSAQINASISGNTSPQLFRVQQQPGQAPQTMALINGQLVPVSTTPLPVPDSGSVPKPVVLPQVQIQVQGPAAVNMQASIVQKQPTTEISTSTSTQQKTNVSENKPEKTELVSSAPTPPRNTTAQAQANNDAIPASRKTRDRGCGCGFWAAIMRPFQQESRRRQNDDNKNDRDNNQTTTANNDNQDDATANQSLGTTAVNMAINPVPAPAPAVQGDPIQASQGLGAADVGQNTSVTFYPLGTNDINAVNAINSQDMYATPTNMMTPDTGQYSVPVQQPPSFLDPSQAVPAPGSGQATDQVAADGTTVDNGNIDGEGEEELVDDGYDDGMDDDY